MSLFDSIKAAISGWGVGDEAYYEAVVKELSEGSIRPGLWAKALAETGYEESKAKARYIQFRVQALKVEVSELRREEEWRRQALANEEQRAEADALPAYQRGDHEQAYRGFRLLAAKKQPWAQNYLAFMLEHGQGVAQNLNAAIDLYKEAAAQNDRDAQFNLGRMCLRRYNDYQSAQVWFSMAHRNGHPDARRMRRQATDLMKAQKKVAE